MIFCFLVVEVWGHTYPFHLVTPFKMENISEYVMQVRKILFYPLKSGNSFKWPLYMLSGIYISNVRMPFISVEDNTYKIKDESI